MPASPAAKRFVVSASQITEIALRALPNAHPAAGPI